MADFDRGYFVGAFRRMAATAEEHRDEWTKLDGDIGDGDHGINMSIGFREVVKQLDALPDDTDVAGLFKLVGMTLLRKVGGASGPLYGSFFMKAGAEVADQSEVSFDDLRRMLRAGVDSIQQRGKAELGDKTMLDSYLPGLDVLEAADAADPQAALTAFVERMRQGSDDTIPLVAKKGRAMRLGERSVGHRDPGSQSSWMLMNCLLDELKGLKVLGVGRDGATVHQYGGPSLSSRRTPGFQNRQAKAATHTLALTRHCAESPRLFMYRTPESCAPEGTSNTIQPFAH